MLSFVSGDGIQVTPRLMGQLKALENRLEAHELDDVMYGSVDTWIIYKLTREKTFAIDVSCACATGFYDLFLVSCSLSSRFL